MARWLSPYSDGGAWTGVTELAAIWLVALVFSYALEAVQTWLMQWTGQKVMFDLRRQIFRHMQQMHIAFFDRNPVGRLVTRLTTDVDALNEMFTSGVFAIFEDVFVLAAIVFVMLQMKWWLALLAFSVLPLILLATRIFRKYVREILPAHSGGDRADQCLHPGVHHRHVAGAAVQSPGAGLSGFFGD